MKIKYLLNSLILFTAALVFSGPARADLVDNGGFDGSALGWTWTHIDGAGGWRSDEGNPGGAFILNDNGNSTTDPTLEQLVDGLVPGDQYQLSGDYSGIYCCYGSRSDDTFAVDVGSSTYLFDYPGLDTWGSFEVDFTAPDTQVLIRFRAEIGGDDTSYVIDNIALEPLAPVGAAPVPLPGVLMLLAGGLLALAAARSLALRKRAAVNRPATTRLLRSLRR